MENTQLQQANTQLVQQRENWLIQNTLDAGQQKLVKFFNHPTVKDVDDTTLKQIIDTGISVAAQDLGKLIEDDDVLYMVNEIFFYLRDKFQSLRVVEVKIAFQRGVAKEYGDFYGFNTATLKGFIGNYMNDFNRSEAIKRFMGIKHQAELKPEPTEAEKEAQALKNIADAIEIHKQKGWYNDFGNVIFLELKRRKPELFDFTDKEIAGFYKQGKQRLINEYSADTGITLLNKRERVFRLKQIASLKKWDDILKDTEVVSEANKVALNCVLGRLVG